MGESQHVLVILIGVDAISQSCVRRLAGYQLWPGEFLKFKLSPEMIVLMDTSKVFGECIRKA